MLVIQYFKYVVVGGVIKAAAVHGMRILNIDQSACVYFKSSMLTVAVSTSYNPLACMKTQEISELP